MKVVLNWCKTHGYPVKIKGNTVYFQTRVSTAEYDTETGTLRWHEKNFFEKILDNSLKI